MFGRRRWLVALVAATALLSTGCVQELRSRLGEAIGLPVDINDFGTILAIRYSGGIPQGVLVNGLGGDLTLINGPAGAGFAPYAINDRGVVVGATISGNGREVRSRAVTWTRGRGFRTLALPEGTFQSWATDINNRGQVLVNAFSPSGSPADGAYLGSEEADVARLADPPGAPNGRPSVADAINESGLIVGASGNGSAAGAERAVEWDAATRAPRILEALGEVSHALDVNEAGSIVGSATPHAGEVGHGVAWLAGGTRELIDLGPGIANAINDHGYIVGQDATSAPPIAASWVLSTRIKLRLGELAAGGGSSANAVNNWFAAVGDSGGRPSYYIVPR
jgi:uncharacterized membrane protein